MEAGGVGQGGHCGGGADARGRREGAADGRFTVVVFLSTDIHVVVVVVVAELPEWKKALLAKKGDGSTPSSPSSKPPMVKLY